MWPLTRSRQKFRFIDTGPLIDNELELVQPQDCYIDDVLSACNHALTVAQAPEMARTSEFGLHNFLEAAPLGRHPASSRVNSVPSYHFWMRLSDQRYPVKMGGTIALRIGDNHNLTHYIGHIGYNVYPPARGHHLAERSTRLLLALALEHGMKELWITCNPENHPSRRTCERLGGKLAGIVDVPSDHDLYQRGEYQKCRYLITL